MAANAAGTTLEPSLAPELVRYGALDHLASDTLDQWSSRHFDFAFPPLNEKAYRAVDDLLQPPRYGEVTRALRNGTTFCSVRGQLVQHECNELHHGSR